VLNKYNTKIQYNTSHHITMASRLGTLNLSNPNATKTWIRAFSALGRSKGWTDDKNSKNYEITDNFMSHCGLESLEKIQYTVEVG
jgi:hypothetical protein